MDAQVEKSGCTLETIRQQVVGVEKEVPLLDGRTTRYIYFDNAASTPILQPVLDAVNEFMEWYSSVHRGTGFKSRLATHFHEYSREVVARFVNVDLDHHTVIFGKNATEAINKLAHRVDMPPESIVLCTRMEHHSNDLPWRQRARVIHVEVDEQGRLIEEDLIAKLEKYHRKVALFAVTGASNVTGWVNDVHRLAEICHSYGVKIMVDAAQWIPHRRVDMKPQDDPQHIDFLAFSAHKIYAPLGAGVLIADKDAFAEGPPDLVGGGTVDVVSLDYAFWTALPEREEAGSPNTVGIVALAKALQVMEELGMENVAAHEARLTRYALERLNRMPNLTIYGGTDPDHLENRMGVIAFNVEGVPNALTAAILGWEGGIGVRNGCFCAHPYIKHLLRVNEQQERAMEERILRGDRSNLPGAVRVSFGIYNTEAEIDAFLEVLERIVRREWEGEYVEDSRTGEFHPRGVEIPMERYFAL
ncbi:MAG: aminotransferase class V-fold PLP-dependent enzyme [Calditrichaeota bacterium]|nr:MAG: aminotransferase class V-fold PLP-dependent enzyme [Calditrichota bacterium]